MPVLGPPPPRPAQKEETVAGFSPRPQPVGTLLFLTGLAITGLTLRGKVPSGMARYAAVCVGLSFASSALVDLRLGFPNLIRPDLLAILSLYFLTLFEFLFRQPNFDDLVGGDLLTEKVAIIACLWGFAGLAIGRHIPNLRKHPLAELFARPVRKSWIIFLFWSSIFLGFFYMLLTVHFNPVLLVEWLISPRFTQPWVRSKFGDWKALLHEIEMLLFLAPPLAGIIIARRKDYSKLQVLLVLPGLLFVLFYGFAGGTRNVLASYIVTFLISYSFAAGAGRKKELMAIAGACAIGFFFASVLMLRFREVGIRDYLTGNYEIDEEPREQTLFIDYNLYSIYRLVQVFPRTHGYLGWEIPYMALVRPIPRALWHGKPEGMSMSIEDALGVEGLTVSASFVGEAYMSGGIIAVFATGILFGFITGWWGRLASTNNSEFGILTYASGFFAAIISMRSLLVFTTALLPTAISVAVGYVVLQKARERRETALGAGGRAAAAAPLPATGPNRAGDREKVRSRWFTK